MTNVSKNGLDLIKLSSQKLKGNFNKMFIATLMVVSPAIAMLVLGLVTHWVVSLIAACLIILLYGILATGYMKYYRGLVAGENPKLKVIISNAKTGWLRTFVGAITIILFLIGSVLFIIPGLVLIGYYSMSLYIVDHYNTNGLSDSLKLSQEKMNGNIVSMYSYKLIFWLMYFLTIVLGVFGGWGVYVLYATSPVIAVILGIIGVMLLSIAFSAITVYYHACNEFFFQEVLIYDEKKKARKAAKTATKVESPATETKVEQPKEEVKKVEATKPAAKKPAAKK